MANEDAYQGDLFAEIKTAHHRSRGADDPLGWIRFGTSTWAYPGWKGLVYSKKHKSTTDYLREYLEFPEFRTAGADFTFYRPADANTLREWKTFLPGTFRMVFKVWDELTIDRFQKIDQQHRPIRKENQPNPHFLDPEIFEQVFLAPFVEAGFHNHVAAFLFQFRQSTCRDRSRFLDRLARFLDRLPAGWPYAIEVREPSILGPDYADVLRQGGASHVYNHWERMPSLADQKEKVPFTGRVMVSRILTPLKMPYAVAKRKFAPYDTLLPENILPEMRKDVVALALEAIRNRLPGYILVNNRSEGCAPLTIRALSEMLESAVAGKNESP